MNTQQRKLYDVVVDSANVYMVFFLYTWSDGNLSVARVMTVVPEVTKGGGSQPWQAMNESPHFEPPVTKHPRSCCRAPFSTSSVPLCTPVNPPWRLLVV